MIKLEKYEVMGWEHVIRGMRNPMNSWEKSDSRNGCVHGLCKSCGFNINWCGCTPRLIIGEDDHKLMMKLRNAGTDHRKFMRMIQVYVDITAPLYWWKEFDTYKVGTVANSCSTMHKIHEKEFTSEDFSIEDLDDAVPTDYGLFSTSVMAELVNTLEFWRKRHNSLCEMLKNPKITAEEVLSVSAKVKHAWKQMIQLLPTSYNQKRTVMLNYEVLANMYKSRKNHKLDEWREFCQWIEKLPYSELITGEVKEEER